MLYGIKDKDDYDSGYSTEIILFKDEGYIVPEIRRRITNNHDISIIRKCMHRFNEQGIEGITSKIHTRKPLKKITDEIEKKKIVEIATINPRKDYGTLLTQLGL